MKQKYNAPELSEMIADVDALLCQSALIEEYDPMSDHEFIDGWK